MRRVFLLAVTASFIFMCISSGEAFLFGKKKQEPAAQTNVNQASATAPQAPVASKEEAPKAEVAKAEPVKPKIDKTQKEAIEFKRKLMEKKRNELNNTEWQIELAPMSGKGNKEGETVVFKNNQVSLVGYGKRGFPTTNYTLTVQDDGSAVWETMQTSEKSGIAFLRGEIDAAIQNMRGVLSHRIDEATAEDYSFVSTSKKSISPAPPQEE
jgi:hypothetical protein